MAAHPRAEISFDDCIRNEIGRDIQITGCSFEVPRNGPSPEPTFLPSTRLVHPPTGPGCSGNAEKGIGHPQRASRISKDGDRSDRKGELRKDADYLESTHGMLNEDLLLSKRDVVSRPTAIKVEPYKNCTADPEAANRLCSRLTLAKGDDVEKRPDKESRIAWWCIVHAGEWQLSKCNFHVCPCFASWNELVRPDRPEQQDPRDAPSIKIAYSWKSSSTSDQVIAFDARRSHAKRSKTDGVCETLGYTVYSDRNSNRSDKTEMQLCTCERASEEQRRKHGDLPRDFNDRTAEFHKPARYRIIAPLLIDTDRAPQTSRKSGKANERVTRVKGLGQPSAASINKIGQTNRPGERKRQFKLLIGNDRDNDQESQTDREEATLALQSCNDALPAPSLLVQSVQSSKSSKNKRFAKMQILYLIVTETQGYTRSRHVLATSSHEVCRVPLGIRGAALRTLVHLGRVSEAGLPRIRLVEESVCLSNQQNNSIEYYSQTLRLR
ncbi:hypothetical protein WN55_07078 [Dufourea novaeangliae]|uniref:Uncharacterized protein n=1 Tax=Dufourea novaeangliae TaxID=178035 RepID=A0A154PRX5_DUFNO|nr:hypothetical protein WN55_07078 [Dufourea novaeangliae]